MTEWVTVVHSLCPKHGRRRHQQPAPHVVDGVIDDTASFEWVLTQVWKALGTPPSIKAPAYFPPDDVANYDWDKHRLR